MTDAADDQLQVSQAWLDQMAAINGAHTERSQRLRHAATLGDNHAVTKLARAAAGIDESTGPADDDDRDNHDDDRDNNTDTPA